MPTTSYIGKPANRVDGRAKVTGQAKYPAEFHVPGLLYGFVVSSAIAKGRITRVNAERARSLEGVVEIFTHENRPRKSWFEKELTDDLSVPGQPFVPLRDERIIYSAQPIALVVAETYELARYAASLVQVGYEVVPHATNLSQKRPEGYPPKPRDLVLPPAKERGDLEAVLANGYIRHEAEYSLPIEHHNPIEMHSSTAIYEGEGKLLVYDKTQGVHNTLNYLCNAFELSQANVRVLSPFVGGAFGSGLSPQYQLFLAVMAALTLKRSVKVTLTRQQMFTFGHRPACIQGVTLAAMADGTLQGLGHEALSETSQYQDYSENIVNWSGRLYRCNNVRLRHNVAHLDLPTPCDMRAPGAPTGLFALETALDELAYKLKLDPLELRLKNYADRAPDENKPFSSKELRECYRQGAERFGWARRKPEPRSMKEGRNLVGWGMATGIWEALYTPTSAKAVLTADGRLEVSSGTADIGTGTYTIMTQIAAETLGLPLEMVHFKLGDSSLPYADVEGGSWMAASCGSAVKEVCDAVGKRLLQLAQQGEGSPFAGVEFGDVMFADGEMRHRREAFRRMLITEIMQEARVNRIEEQTDSKATHEAMEAKQKDYVQNTHSAVFAEVKVDEDFGTIHVTRVVSAIAAGRILNPKTAASQIIGSVVWGIGMALVEESVVDHNLGRIVNHNLGEYHVPVNADVHDIDVIFVEERDAIVNPIGVKGVGEIGLCGVAAAIGNAVFHATGKRVRHLPITLDKVFQ